MEFTSHIIIRRMRMRKCIAMSIVLLACAVGTVQPQWSSDPNVNLAVVDTAGSQELPKLAVTTDGGCYVAWFDNRGGGYKVFMQRLNANGVKQWPEGGLLISAHPQNSSLVDYDLAVDDSNHAVVVFTDVRNGGSIEPFAYRISPQGNFVWGANGVALSTSSSTFQPNPKVVATSDGNFVFAWIFSSTPRKVAMQKLNAAGVKQWGNDPLLVSGTGSELLDYPNLVRSDNGSVILSMSGYTGSFISPGNYRIYTQKYSPAGSPLWGANPDTVYGLGRVSGFFVPRLIPDGANGAVYVWQDDRNSTGSSFTHVQRMTANGTKLFPANGSAASTLPARLHNDAWAAVAPATNETFVFWYETDAAFQNAYGVYGQRFSPSGARAWSDSGKAVRPLTNAQPSFVRTFAKDSSAVVFYLDGVTVTTSLVRGARLDRNGNLLWGGTIKDLSIVSSGKGRLTGGITSAGTSLLAWADKRLDANGVYAQNIHFDGRLGIVTSVAGTQQAVPAFLNLHQNYPNPFNPSTMMSYDLPEAGHVSLIVYDLLGRPVATIVNDVQKAGRHTTEFFPQQLASGVYLYTLNVGGFKKSMKMILMR